MKDNYQYDAFISYRHTDPDKKWAKWLHKELESFRTPNDLVAKGYPRKLEKVFRDEEEFAAASRLSAAIVDALSKSRFLIVVCSPRLAQSAWVKAEIEYFIEKGWGDRVLLLLVEGSPAESFPQAFQDQTKITVYRQSTLDSRSSIEPLAADVRNLERENLRQVRRRAKLKILARLLGCKFDDLQRRDQLRRRRRHFAIGLIAISTAIVTITIVLIFYVQAVDERGRRFIEETYNAIHAARALATTGNVRSALEKILAVPSRSTSDNAILLAALTRIAPITTRTPLIQREIDAALEFALNESNVNPPASGVIPIPATSIGAWESCNIITVGTDTGDLHVINQTTGETQQILRVSEATILHVDISGNCRTALTMDADGQAAIVDIESRTVKQKVAGFPDRASLFLGAHWFFHNSVMYRVDNGKKVAHVDYHELLPRRDILLTAERNGVQQLQRVRLWDNRTGIRIYTFTDVREYKPLDENGLVIVTYSDFSQAVFDIEKRATIKRWPARKQNQLLYGIRAVGDDRVAVGYRACGDLLDGHTGIRRYVCDHELLKNWRFSWEWRDLPCSTEIFSLSNNQLVDSVDSCIQNIVPTDKSAETASERVSDARIGSYELSTLKGIYTRAGLNPGQIAHYLDRWVDLLSSEARENVFHTYEFLPTAADTLIAVRATRVMYSDTLAGDLSWISFWDHYGNRRVDWMTDSKFLIDQSQRYVALGSEVVDLGHNITYRVTGLYNATPIAYSPNSFNPRIWFTGSIMPSGSRSNFNYGEYHDSVPIRYLFWWDPPTNHETMPWVREVGTYTKDFEWVYRAKMESGLELTRVGADEPVILEVEGLAGELGDDHIDVDVSTDGSRALVLQRTSMDGRYWEKYSLWDLNKRVQLADVHGEWVSAKFTEDENWIVAEDSTGLTLFPVRSSVANVFGADVTPVLRQLVVSEGNVIALTLDGGLVVHSAGTQEAVRFDGIYIEMSVSKDRILTVDGNGKAKIWTVSGDSVQDLDQCGGKIISAKYSTDGEMILGVIEARINDHQKASVTEKQWLCEWNLANNVTTVVQYLGRYGDAGFVNEYRRRQDNYGYCPNYVCVFFKSSFWVVIPNQSRDTRLSMEGIGPEVSSSVSRDGSIFMQMTVSGTRYPGFYLQSANINTLKVTLECDHPIDQPQYVMSSWHYAVLCGKRFRLVDNATGLDRIDKRGELDDDQTIVQIALSADGRYLALQYKNRIEVIDPHTLNIIFSRSYRYSGRLNAKFSPASTMLHIDDLRIPIYGNRLRLASSATAALENYRRLDTRIQRIVKDSDEMYRKGEVTFE